MNRSNTGKQSVPSGTTGVRLKDQTMAMSSPKCDSGKMQNRTWEASEAKRWRKRHVEEECEVETYFLTPGQINQVELAGQFVSSLSVFLLDVNEEDAVTSGAVLVHV